MNPTVFSMLREEVPATVLSLQYVELWLRMLITDPLVPIEAWFSVRGFRVYARDWFRV